MSKDQAQTDITDLARQTQALFNLNGAAMPRVETVMKVQEGMLEQAETFTRHWIERRQEAVETGLEALNKISPTGKPDPATAMRAIVDWQRGSVERLNADLQDWMTMCLQATQLATAEQAKAASSEADQGKATAAKGKATAAQGRSATSGKKSDHATPV